MSSSSVGFGVDEDRDSSRPGHGACSPHLSRQSDRPGGSAACGYDSARKSVSDIRPWRMANRAARARLETPILLQMCSTWLAAVFGDASMLGATPGSGRRSSSRSRSWMSAPRRIRVPTSDAASAAACRSSVLRIPGSPVTRSAQRASVPKPGRPGAGQSPRRAQRGDLLAGRFSGCGTRVSSMGCCLEPDLTDLRHSVYRRHPAGKQGRSGAIW